MKKLLEILVLGLLWCNVGFAETMEVTKPSLSDDVRQMVIDDCKLSIENEVLNDDPNLNKAAKKAFCNCNMSYLGYYKKISDEDYFKMRDMQGDEPIWQEIVFYCIDYIRKKKLID